MATSIDIYCCICEEVYDLHDKKPLLLPCSHSFCHCCLQQMQLTNNQLCPICRASWEGQSVDSLPFIRQLVEPADKIKSKKDKSNPKKNTCVEHVADLLIWCCTCEVSLCIQCLKEQHKSCDWVQIKEKTNEMMKNLQESVDTTRAKLVEKISLVTTENDSKLADVRINIKKLRHCERIILSFARKLSTKQEEIMNLLEDNENIPSDSNVEEIAITISKTLSLLDDPIIVPTVPKCVVPECDVPEGDADVDDIAGVSSEEVGGKVFMSTELKQMCT